MENLIWWNLYNAGAPWNRRPPHFAGPFAGEISELQQHPGARHTLVMRGLVDSFFEEPQVIRPAGGTRDPVES